MINLENLSKQQLTKFICAFIQLEKFKHPLINQSAKPAIFAHKNIFFVGHTINITDNITLCSHSSHIFPEKAIIILRNYSFRPTLHIDSSITIDPNHNILQLNGTYLSPLTPSQQEFASTINIIEVNGI